MSQMIYYQVINKVWLQSKCNDIILIWIAKMWLSKRNSVK